MKFSRPPWRNTEPGPGRIPRPKAKAGGAEGFTLLEVLVATAIFAILAMLLLSMTSEASKLWQRAEGQKARRQIARIILETVSRDLEAATFPLATNATNSLQFLLGGASGVTNLNPSAAFWQTAAGNGPASGLAEVGYFVQWQGGKSALCRYYVPGTNADSLFSSDQSIWKHWLTPAKVQAYAPGLQDSNSFAGLLAENVLGLWITLYDADNTAYTNYDSRVTAARPVSAEVGIAIVDPRTAQRITSSSIPAYPASIDAFPDSLPPEIREGVQIFKTRIQMQSSR